MECHVLVALGDGPTRDFYARGLQSAGFDVRICAPDAALQAALGWRPDVMVIDGSPLNGVPACQAFKTHHLLRAIPIVALASSGGASHFDRLCDAVLPVHCLPDVLVETIDRILRASR